MCAVEWGSRKDRWIRNLKMWVFSSQLCPLPAWPLTCHLSFMEFLFYPVEIIITNLKEYFSDMMWVKVLGLSNENVWNLCQCLGIMAKRIEGPGSWCKQMGRKHLKEQIHLVFSARGLISKLSKVMEHSYYLLCIT